MIKKRRGHSQAGSAAPHFLLTVGVIAALGVVLSIEATRFSEMKRLRDRTLVMQEDLASANAKAEAALSAVISPDALRAAKESVYLITVNGAARGTAFVIDREKGLLATAAHTAASLPLDDANAQIRIINRTSGTPLDVTSIKVHAGFGAFRTLVEDYQPIRKNSSIYAPQAAPLRDLAFDAGLLFVEPIDQDTGEMRLGQNLDIAAEEELLELQAGAPIAVIGFPYDTLDDGFAPEAAIPRIERGVIAAMTPPLDHYEVTPDPRIANLIIHRLATAGGNSGSPIINAAGQVIGIHTHGIASASSNADGAAQRAEVIYDLLDTEREENRLQSVFFPAWEELLSYWARAEDTLPQSFFMEYAEPGKTPAPRVASFNFNAPARYSKTITRHEFEPATDSRRVYASDLTRAKVSNNNTSGRDIPLNTQNGPSFLIEDKGEFAVLTHKVDRSQENVLFAFDYSLRSKKGFCRIASYWRKKGETRLRAMRERASFELHLPAQGNVTEEYQIVLRRPAGCDPASAEFFFGSISWPADDNGNIVAASYTSDNRLENLKTSANERFQKARLAVEDFFACKVNRNNKAERCIEPVFIELDKRRNDRSNNSQN